MGSCMEIKSRGCFLEVLLVPVPSITESECTLQNTGSDVLSRGSLGLLPLGPECR